MQENMKAVQTLIDKIIEFGVNYGFDVLGAVLILIIGFFIANRAAFLFARFLDRKKVDITLAKFVTAFVRILIVAFAVIIALGKFGITITPLVAALSAAAFGATFAFQAPLSNYGAGLSIILARPFAVGDTITVQGMSGVVEDVKLVATVILTEDGVRITIPNRHIVGEVVQNSKANRIVDAVVGTSYGDDPEKAIRAIRSVLAANPQVAKDPAPQVGISQFGESSVDIGVRYWVPTKFHFQIFYAVNLAIWKALKAEGITIPFPQRDVHLIPDEDERSSLSQSAKTLRTAG